MTRAPSHDRLATMADDIRQLVEPIHTAVPQRNARGRIVAWRRETHPCLLDDLRAAITPTSAGNERPERRPVPDSRPPIRLDAIDTLAEIYVALAAWQARLDMPLPGPDHDWWKAALRQLIGEAANLAPSIADQLADDVHHWWTLAARHSPWHPDDLLRLRRP